jgi:hypothetical protein
VHPDDLLAKSMREIVQYGGTISFQRVVIISLIDRHRERFWEKNDKPLNVKTSFKRMLKD